MGSQKSYKWFKKRTMIRTIHLISESLTKPKKVLQKFKFLTQSSKSLNQIVIKLNASNVMEPNKIKKAALARNAKALVLLKLNLTLQT